MRLCTRGTLEEDLYMNVLSGVEDAETVALLHISVIVRLKVCSAVVEVPPELRLPINLIL